MKKLITILTISSILFTSCNQIPKGYMKYQTFDEYSLKGVNSNKEIVNPYVIIKREKDTITVRICRSYGFVSKLLNYISSKNPKYVNLGDYGNNGELIKYINKGKYWYNITKEQTDPRLYFTTECDTVPYYTEKFIYNDTILRYGYYMDDNDKKGTENFTLITRNNEICLSPGSFRLSPESKFIQLKNLFADYKHKYPNYISEHQKSSYTFHNKVLKGDTLFLYKYDDKKRNYRFGCLDDVYILNSLGEFKRNYDHNFLSEIKKEDLCK